MASIKHLRFSRLIPILYQNISEIRNQTSTNSAKKLKLLLKKPQFFSLAFLPSFFTVQALFSKKNETKVVNKIDEFQKVISEADEFYKAGNFEDLYNLLMMYEDCSNVEILWRLSRATFEKGKSLSSSSDQLVCYKKGLNYVNKGLEIDNNHSLLHKWFAILNDYKSRCEGTRSRIENALLNKEHMIKSINLSEKGDPTTVYMLGYWCFAFASLAWYEKKIASVIFATPPSSTYEEALEYFDKAENMEPNFYSMNLLMLGKCHEKLGNKEVAIKYLQQAANYPGNSSDDIEAKNEAKEMLKKLDK